MTTPTDDDRPGDFHRPVTHVGASGKSETGDGEWHISTQPGAPLLW